MDISEYRSLCYISDKFLEINQKEYETNIEFLHRIANTVGCELPKDIKFKE